MKTLASMLVDLHRQFDTLELGAPDFQRQVLDALANNASTLEAYQQVFVQWLQAKKRVE